MSIETKRWVTRPVWLRYTLGEKKLFNLQFSMAVLDAHFTELSEGTYESWSDWSSVPREVDGVLIRSQPTRNTLPRLERTADALRYVPSQYQRYYLEFNSTFAEYLGRFSSKHRSNLKREVRKFTEMNGGTLDSRAYKTPEEVAEFFSLARALSSKTFQERLLDAGLPGTDEYRDQLIELARQGRIRAYLLFHGDKPVSYLLTEIREPDILLYRFLGYDPEYRSWSPGSVLHYVALERLFEEGGLRMLDFTEGEGMHKQLLSTGSQQCADLYFFRPTLRTRAMLWLHTRLQAFSKSIVNTLDRFGLKARVKKLIRAWA
jgi:CelD/BcsL family acetyltransferase involved in cellulose biosynthesis